MAQRLRLVFVIAGVVFLASGCTTRSAEATAEGGGFVYKRGEGRTNLPYDVETVFNAAVATIEQDMKLQIEDKAYDLTTGLVDAFRADGNKAKVRLYYRGKSVTEARAGVGIIGDRVWTQLFFENLEARLAK